MKTSAKIMRAYELNDSVADSDKLLMLRVWEMEGLSLSETQQRIFIDKCTAAESITRCRRQLIKEGSINAKDAVTRARRKREVETTHFYRERSSHRPLYNGPGRNIQNRMEFN